MFAHRNAWIGLVAVLALTAVGCTTTDGQSDNSKYSKKRAQPTQTVQEPQIKRVSAPEGFYAEMHDGRIWVFKEDAKELQKFLDGGELAKHVIRPGAGPGGATLKAPDMETIIEYMAAKPGFHTAVRDGRIWVFKEDAKELQKFREGGELAKHVIRPGAGPSGVTLKAPDTETIIEYMAAKRGFHTSVHDGRIWVFREDSKELQKFKDMGELAKHVIRPGAGPGGTTLKAPDTETLNSYLAAR